ncbi:MULTISPECIES: dermonecrotic toxin domain-containing protein [Pseudomonas]|uniref:Dermonecrotic toxin n=1 Tax=Pseudomonas fluorescens TaxID=294 RepID=A0A109KM04_PSEFL|nr:MULTISPECIES: DUF6543 domain-containing protein [Pseudomonas]KAA6195318.1 hypothetical protein F3K52_10590 [Pseudomonas lactis]KRC91226.1 hypothetical protein ASE33_08260 [Pseudomonas sp. Root9]KWV71705.1 Dermonecrotic toxin [Pseudomonas fluorescens]
MSLSINPIPSSASLPSGIAYPTPSTQTQTPSTVPPTAKTGQPDETALLKAYLEAAQRKVLHGNAGLITVPPQSTLGQWLGLYRTLLENNVVQSWLREQHVAADTLLSINPSTGTLSAEVEGKTKTFQLSDTSGWGQISGPLLDAAKVIAPGNNGDLRVRLRKDSIQVSAKVVANFEGVTLPQTLTQARAQIRHLEHKDTFDPIPADDRLRPASSRSAQALQEQQHNAAKYYSTAPQALAYKRLAVDVANNLPNTRAEAKKWADDLLLKLTGKPIDSDTVYLNRFKGGESADTATGWEHTFQEPWSSLRLPDALLKNFSEHDWVPGNLDLDAGLYTQPAGQSEKGGYGKHNQIDLKPSQVMHESWKTDFQTQMTQKFDAFWSAHTDDYQTVIKGEFVSQAREQLKSAEAGSSAERALQAPEHQFTRGDYSLVMAAANNIPLDENTPLSLEQLKAKAPVNSTPQVHALDIHGFKSSDILRFSNDDAGRQVLYIPGAKPAFLRFDSLDKLNQWVIDQTKDPKKSQSLLAHFSLADRQNRKPSVFIQLASGAVPGGGFTGIGDTQDGLDALFKKMAAGDLKTPVNKSSQSKIEGDVFSTLATAAKQRMTSDTDVVVKSNSEVTRDTWLNDITVAAGLLAKLAPIAAPVTGAAVIAGLTELGLGFEQSASGDTEAERDNGASRALDGVLNTLFSMGASTVPEDPFALPPEKELPVSDPLAQPHITEIEEPKPGPSSGTQVVNEAGAAAPKSRPLLPMAPYAVPEGEQLIKDAPRDALGVYRITDSQGALRQFVRLTDETGTSKVFEISGRYRTGDMFARVINPDNGAGLMVITPGRDGEWARAPGDGGVKLPWPWPRSESPTPSDDIKTPTQVSDNFIELNGTKMKGADIFDKYFNVEEQANYKYGVSFEEDNGVLKNRPVFSWTADSGDFTVSASERASSSPFGTSNYSDQFAKDIDRDPYTIRRPGVADVEIDIPRQMEGMNIPNGLEESIRENLIRDGIDKFEHIVPDPDMRAAISEVAHQGSSASVWFELQPPRVKPGFSSNVGKRRYVIDYNPLKNETEVTITTQWHLKSEVRGESTPADDVNITATRTFTLRESNEIDGQPVTIDKSAPIRIEVSPSINVSPT